VANRKVLILYQYDHRSQGLDEEKFVLKTENLLNGAKVQTIDIAAERLSKAGDPSASATIYSEFVNAVRKYDYAVALFTVDERPASTAGNLWFEVGYWYAARGGHTLLIIEHVMPGSEDKLRIPSNLQGVVYRRGGSAEEVKAHFSDFLENAEAYSRRRAIEDFAQGMIDTTWIRSDKEDMEIAELAERPKSLAKLDHLKVFSMVSTVTRIVNEQPSELIFHLLVAPFQQSELPFTYRQILGLGRLRAEDQSAIHQLVLDAQETDNGITDFFEISKFRISAPDQEGRDQEGRDQEGRDQEGRVVMPPTHYRPGESRRLVYRCEWERSVGPYKIEFEVKSIVFEQHAWHTYRTHWCISDQLSVSLKAPNKLDCFCDVWPIKQATKKEGRIGRKYISAVDLKGPIFAGSEVRWLFHASKRRGQ
jgi:Predicted nucleotide-binding protein containing TIR-like domain